MAFYKYNQGKDLMVYMISEESFLGLEMVLMVLWNGFNGLYIWGIIFGPW